jgi:hypothetical protein
MNAEPASQRLHNYLSSQGVACGGEISRDRISEFERRYNVLMPSDLADYFATINGTDGDAYGIIHFWDLSEVKTVEEEILAKSGPGSAVIQAAYSAPTTFGKHYFVFADCLYEAQLYAIRLSLSQHGANDVILLDGGEPIEVAESFSHFVELYIKEPGRLRLILD